MSSLDPVTDGAERTGQGGGSFWLETARKQKAAGMDRLDYLVYDPERLACTVREKDACLETVRKLIRLSCEIRRNGVLAAGILAETEPDPFFRACLLELECEEGYIELEDMPARLDRVLAAYLAAERRELVERERDYDPNAISLFAKDIERAQSEILGMKEP